MTYFNELGRQIARAAVAAQMQEAMARSLVRLALIDVVARFIGPDGQMFASGGVIVKDRT